jgi:predicted RNase H-like HicB family nuclease
MEKYLVIIGKTATGYSAHCPDVDGCAAVGVTVEDTILNMRDALVFHFEGMHEDGDAIPLPGGTATYESAIEDSDVGHELLTHVAIDTARFETQLSVA